MCDTPQFLALVRHGQSFANICTERPTNSLYYAVSGSDRTVGITPRGELQSSNSGDLLARLFTPENPVSAMWLSGFDRVKRSGEIIASRLGYEIPSILVDERLDKRSYGRFWNLTYRGVKELYPEEYEIYQRLGALKYRPPEGENYFDLFERVDDFLGANLGVSSGNQVIVSHLAVILTMQMHLEGLSPLEVVRQYEKVCIPNAYILLYVRKPGTTEWKRAFLSDYLYGGVLAEGCPPAA